MSRPSTSGIKAAREALRFVDPYISEIVDIMSDELNFRQRYDLRLSIYVYLRDGTRRRTKDQATQQCCRDIIVTYINPDELY